MFATFTSALLLLASAAVAQTTPSVVTFISISPTPASEQIFSIQTIIPGVYSTTACYEACVMEPCPPCGVTSSVSGSMGIPQGETPIPSSLLSSAPAPASSNISASSGSTPSRTLTGSGNATVPSATRSAPAQQSTAAASPSLQGAHAPLKLALGVSGLALFGAALIFL
ncbi:hypothetical protein CC86DRAFT_370435 [Ophiobolus disseminans]|uniref:Uncharacterized protein n=1 Tax=Ophiobolus disseminans TaxID=1469910 RepID=A0A6A6ZZE7_9PLEO|nr:hypothetical protein CC86DRAFT_370435 [Ophiobolus disseminans]